MVDFRAGTNIYIYINLAENYLFVAKKWESVQKMIQICQMHIGTSLKELGLAKSGIIWASK